LKVFRDYLMTPGQMLCLGGPDLEKHKASLAQLTAKGFLVAEKHPGGFSLTDAGFAAMRQRKPTRT
jgi:hypothetical protein